MRNARFGGKRPSLLIQLTLCTLSAIFAAGCGDSFTAARSPGDFRAAIAQQVSGVSLVGAPKDADETKLVAEEAARSEACEVTLKLTTWDSVVYSDKVCIKSPGKGVAIPSRIALNTKKNWKVERKRYCEEKRDDGLCVWNRQYFDMYPLDFIFETPDGTSMAQRLSLIRVIRGAKVVYSWDPRHAPADTKRVVVAGRSVVQPDYFKGPVDLGLYVLPSGVEEATAAVAVTYTDSRRKLGQVLATAASRALKTSIPDKVQADFECFQQRLEYVRALMDDDATAQAAAKTRIGELATGAQDLDAAAKAAFALTLATEEKLVEDKAPAILDGTTLKQGDSALFLSRDGAHAQIRQFDNTGKAWLKFPDTTVMGVSPVKGTQDRFGKIGSGPRAGRFYKLANWTKGDDTPAVREEVGEHFACVDPGVALDQANNELKSAVDSAATKGRDAVVGAVSEKSRDLGNKVGVVLDQARRDLRDSMDHLPQSIRDRLGDNLVWMRTIDDAVAQVLEAIRMFEAVGPQLEAQVRSTLKDPAAQQRAYNEFARSLPNEESIWAAAAPNPAAGDSEATLEMRFHRPRQFYAFLAWNGVPIAILKSAHVATTPKVDNLIPIIDFAGWYWQHGGSIIPATSVGVGIIGTREEIEEPKYTTSFNVGPQVNFAVSGFRLGIAHIIRETDNCPEKDARCYLNTKNLRVLLGADIIRLFTGKDTAVVKGTSGVSGTTD